MDRSLASLRSLEQLSATSFGESDGRGLAAGTGDDGVAVKPSLISLGTGKGFFFFFFFFQRECGVRVSTVGNSDTASRGLTFPSMPQ